MIEEEKARDLINKLVGRMQSAYTSYFVWKWLEQSRNINIGESKVQRNLSVINQYPNFFHIALTGSFYNFIIDLSTFFDKQNKSLSISKFLSIIPIDAETVKSVNDIIDKNEEKIKYIKSTIRDKEIAHFDLDVDRTSPNLILYRNIEDLFVDVQEIINILARNAIKQEWFWGLTGSNVENDMVYLFDNLERGEKKRIEDIHNKYKI